MSRVSLLSGLGGDFTEEKIVVNLIYKCVIIEVGSRFFRSITSDGMCQVAIAIEKSVVIQDAKLIIVV